MERSIYQFAIDNTKAYIRSPENVRAAERGEGALTVFTASQVLSVAFMKDQNDVVADLVRGDVLDVEASSPSFGR